MWAWVRYAGSGEAPATTAPSQVRDLDIDVCDESGAVCVRLRGLSLYRRDRSGDRADLVGPGANHTTLLLHPHWQERAVDRQAVAPAYARRLIVLCEWGEDSAAAGHLLETRMAGVECLDLSTPQDGLHIPPIEARFHTYTGRLLESIQGVITSKPEDPVLMQVVIPNQGAQQLFGGFLGLLKTAQLEYPKLTCQLLEVPTDEALDGLIDKLEANSRSPGGGHIRYRNGARQVSTWQVLPPMWDGAATLWRDGGTYLITGGAGGLGLLFAREIASQTKRATVILAGRSALDQGAGAAQRQAQLEALRSLGARIEYRAVDVSREDAVSQLIAEIRTEFGGLQGIVHAAGVIRDNFILKKTGQELQEVLAPKVQGLINLDRTTRELDLDCFILFSSLAGAMGNPGQADYAAANAFMDAYAAWRNGLVASGGRRGHTLSVNWPFWQEGGMRLAPATQAAMRRHLGMEPLETGPGMEAFYQALASGKNQVVVLWGDADRLRAISLEAAIPAASEPWPSTLAGEGLSGDEHAHEKGKGDVSTPVSAVTGDALRDKTAAYLTKLIASVIGVPEHRIAVDASLGEYGMDSVMAMQLISQLEKPFGPLSKTLLFEYPDIRTLTDYFLHPIADQLQACSASSQRSFRVQPPPPSLTHPSRRPSSVDARVSPRFSPPR